MLVSAQPASLLLILYLISTKFTRRSQQPIDKILRPAVLTRQVCTAPASVAAFVPGDSRRVINKWPKIPSQEEKKASRYYLIISSDQVFCIYPLKSIRFKNSKKTWNTQQLLQVKTGVFSFSLNQGWPRTQRWCNTHEMPGFCLS